MHEEGRSRPAVGRRGAKHQMLKQVRDAVLVGGLIGAADVIEQPHGDIGWLRSDSSDTRRPLFKSTL